MYVPVFVPHPSDSNRRYRSPTIINKTIIYQDTVLNLTDKGENLSVTKLKVDLEDFEMCMNIIFEENLDIVFNTVQYSHQNKEAIFYTNKKISTERWEKRNELILKYVPKAPNIVEAIERVFASEDTLNPDYISTFSVWLFYKGIETNLKNRRDKIENRIEERIKAIRSSYYVCLHEFNFENNEIHLCIHDGDWNDFYFRKNQGDLYLYKKDGYVLGMDNILSLVGTLLDEYYDVCYSVRNEAQEYIHNIKSVNSVFYCDFSKAGVSIDDSSECFCEEFEVGTFSHSKKFKCECNSNSVHELISGRENEFASKIMVAISDCPECIQERLYEWRQKQIDAIRQRQFEKLEQERRLKEEMERKQKKRDFWRKIIPFLK